MFGVVVCGTVGSIVVKAAECMQDIHINKTSDDVRLIQRHAQNKHDMARRDGDNRRRGCHPPQRRAKSEGVRGGAELNVIITRSCCYT